VAAQGLLAGFVDVLTGERLMDLLPNCAS